MRKFSLKTIGLTGLLLLNLAGSAWAANLLVNGGFEQPALSEGGFDASLKTIPGWQALGGTLELQNCAAGKPCEGSQLVELDAEANGSIVQSVKTAPGQQYRLSLAYSPRPGVAASSNSIEVYFDGQLLATLSADGSDTIETAWQTYTYEVTANGPKATLKFTASGESDGQGGYLDSVTLEPLN